jgi:HK97 family phage portal protein
MTLAQRFRAFFGAGESSTGTALTFVGGGSRQSSADIAVNAGNSLGVAAYFACVRNISEDVARLPAAVYRPTGPGGLERVEASPVAALIGEAPNDEMTAITFRQTMSAWALGWGNAYAEIQRNGMGQPIALWPIHPTLVTIERGAGNAVIYNVLKADGSRVLIPASGMLHLLGMSGDGMYGYSVAKWAAETLGTSMAVQSAAGAFFGNGMQVSGILKHPETLSKEAQERLVQSIEQRHSGAGGRKSFRTMVLEEGMEWTQTSIDPESAQMIETRQFLAVEIARWFRMPPTKIGDLSRSTYSSLEQEAISYSNDTLAPWVTRWEQEIKRKLITSPDEFLRFDMAALQRGDQAARATYYREMYNIGVMSPNEIRIREGMNPYEGGDEYFRPLNMAPAGEQPEDDMEDMMESDMPPEPELRGKRKRGR